MALDFLEYAMLLSAVLRTVELGGKNILLTNCRKAWFEEEKN